MDSWRGEIPVPDNQPADEAFEEEDDEDEDEDEANDGKTSEGGLLLGFINLQFANRLKPFLPKFKETFYAHDLDRRSKAKDVLACYGIYPRIPQLNYFMGGFSL